MISLLYPKIFFFLTTLLVTKTIFGQSEPPPRQTTKPQSIALPQVAIMPWTFFNIPPENISQAKDALKAIHQSLQTSFVKNAATYNDYLASKNIKLPLNATRLANKIAVGDGAVGIPGNRPLTIEPVWCSLADYQVFFLVASDTAKDTIFAIHHTAFAKDGWKQIILPQDHSALSKDDEPQKFNPQKLRSEQINKIKIYIEQQTAQQISEFLTILNDHVPKMSQSDLSTLALNTALSKETTRLDQGSSHCLNLLLIEKLLPEYRVLRPFGGLTLNHLHFYQQQDLVPFKRSNRTVIVRWQPLEPLTIPKQFPLQLNLYRTYSESIFASPSQQGLQEPYLFTVQGNRIQFTVDKNLLAFLKSESSALTSSDQPQVVKVYKAWAYLDRGRAWGIKINDRLAAKGLASEIKGHVVGFYGKELQLKSPRGFNINEGAIIFIRKGQDQIKVGQILEFDQTTFPTPWTPNNL